jgi:large subunit ribosomal protein L15
MIKLSELSVQKGAFKKKKKVGRGTSSGHGKTACRGHKGQRSRAGGSKGKRFEGGQTPLYRRLPKMGTFKNYPFKVRYNILNVGDLNMFDNGAEVNLEALRKTFFSSTLKRSKLPIKILGNGELSRSIKVEANKFSGEALKKIELAKGSAITK